MAHWFADLFGYLTGYAIGYGTAWWLWGRKPKDPPLSSAEQHLQDIEDWRL